MATENPQNQIAPKKKLPGWLKLVIVLVLLGAGLTVVASVGMGLLAGLLSGKGGGKLTRKGLEKLVEKGIEQAGGQKADVQINEGGIIVKNKESGQQLAVQTGQQLPSGFPGDLPIYSPSTVTGTVVMGPMTMVTFESPSSLQNIVSHYQAELPKQGWKAAYTASPDPQSFSGLYRKENRQLTVTISPAGGEGKISVVLSYGVEQAP